MLVKLWVDDSTETGFLDEPAADARAAGVEIYKMEKYGSGFELFGWDNEGKSVDLYPNATYEEVV